ncbi:RagB/SusD family nutrient uptake outer membrane protein [Litoribacter alkaliphilus]|uniref:RagB/SusD family nutrient uptake outer membrane protein n=1 Tax=Litoribacter ruber TaxID=702568 RepID=A0AAP2CJJ2_9BACT|nr:RagB/SusD family nutrient uptake outer membrane protein [Litoribacter alkaliphilus]MBS9524864.1 RagB/SusD family nutrient uptake outer membrane protein [Litoribacter alkaliphilus]
MKFVYRLALAAMLGGSAMMTTGCEGILDVDPRQSIDADGALSSPQAMNAAMNSVYARLRGVTNYGRDLLALSDALADVGVTTNNSGRLIQENNNQPRAHFNLWQNSYYAINEANLILDALAQGVEGATANQISAWEGEAKFLRALYFFDLVRAYSYIPTYIYEPGLVDNGGIPMPLEGSITSEVAQNRFSPRTPVNEVYAQIYTDLEDAIRLLSAGGRGPTYASGSAAHALLSRVALYNGDYTKAIAEATAALESPVGTVMSGMGYVDGWRSEQNPESMFEVRFQIAAESIGVNESLQTTYTTLLDLTGSKNRQGGWGDFVPNATVRGFFGLSAVQIGDDPADNDDWDVTRNEDYRGYLYTTGNTVRNAGRQIESIKFASKSGFAYGDNVPVIRKSEMLLNRAEAYYFNNNPGAALADLNELKAARGLTAVDLSGEALFDEILLERFKEFAFEGHRFFDLKRHGRAIDKRSYLGANAFVPADDFRILPPFPQREVDINTNLNQNRGY